MVQDMQRRRTHLLLPLSGNRRVQVSYGFPFHEKEWFWFRWHQAAPQSKRTTIISLMTSLRLRCMHVTRTSIISTLNKESFYYSHISESHYSITPTWSYTLHNNYQVHASYQSNINVSEDAPRFLLQVEYYFHGAKKMFNILHCGRNNTFPPGDPRL